MFLAKFFKSLFGSRNERLLKKYGKVVKKINELEDSVQKLTDEELKNKTPELKERIKNGAKIEDILPEAFAYVREVAKRKLNMRHFDVQLIGGMALYEGKIAEMRTGEGKTLAVTLPAYLTALQGESLHLVTVNDYLAQRDANWMRPIYEGLGITVGIILHGMEREEKQDAYKCDVVYGTNNEFGFDYLRDNMAFSADERMQGRLSYALVDEADSILIDEARTPLIISGQDEQSSDLYKKINDLIPKLKKQEEKNGPGDYSIDEKSKNAFLTEEGHHTVEGLLTKVGLLPEGASLYDVNHIALMHHLYAGLRAHALFRRDVDYIIKDGQVVIVDEHTGRTMEGRRWSDGLHQAVEAKEGVEIQSENQTLASITLQNYFRLYKKLAGMTGTADTEAFELQQIYALEVVVIPTDKPVVREDKPDLIYMSMEEKFEAIIKDIEDCVERQQPVLVGTISIETSEFLSSLLKKRKIEHNVLNAKYHEHEAKIVAQAGRPSAVTIATNMAGRGTDIVLGGNFGAEIAELNTDDPTIIEERRVKWQKAHDEVIKAGGLRIIGTERHESRRIDNQLRGRSGRQGDPGSSQFYLSVRDNLMRIFVSDRVAMLLSKLGIQKGEAITHPWVNKAIENAQRKVEGHNFDIRKQLLEYDDVANEQRKVIYFQRNGLMETEDISETINEIMGDVINNIISDFIPVHSLVEEWNIKGLMGTFEMEFGHKLDIDKWLIEDESLHEESLREKIVQYFKGIYAEKERLITAAHMRHFEKSVMLNTLDTLWKEHLSTMDYMRQSIHLRGYAQKDPRQEYKREAFTLFSNLLENIQRDVIAIILRVQIKASDNVDDVDNNLRHEPTKIEYKHANAKSVLSGNVPAGGGGGAGLDELESGEAIAAASQEEGATGKGTPYVRTQPKVGRNDPCPCGSGKKYKQCHGKAS